MFSRYLSRPIFNVTVGKAVLGASEVYPNIGGSMTVGGNFIEGPQVVKWTLDGPKGMPQNGEVFYGKNVPVLLEPGNDDKFLSLHIYPDNTVKFIYSRNLPRPSVRGEKYIKFFNISILIDELVFPYKREDKTRLKKMKSKQMNQIPAAHQ